MEQIKLKFQSTPPSLAETPSVPEQTITVMEALKAVTVNGAYQIFEEDRKGSIAAGKAADFVVLERNPLTVPKDELREIRVLETIKSGDTIFRL